MIRLDPFDLKLLDAIQRDGALSTGELGLVANLSGSQCSRRLQRLKAAGVIDHYAAILDPRSLGLGVVAYVSISLQSHSDRDIGAFRERIMRLPEVLECAKITGEADYMLKIVTTDLVRFNEILTANFLQAGEVSSVRSSIVLEQVKSTTALPLAAAQVGN